MIMHVIVEFFTFAGRMIDYANPCSDFKKSYISIFYFFQMFYFWLVLSCKKVQT
jgi:hypothetical protein